tara:strand:- start:91466 stop:92242 length:777 start_codon:yes stop_codon:yes gene_type:complete
MKTSQKSGDSVRQNRISPTSKHDVNLRKNNLVYFQIGLIVALLVVLFAVEYKTPVKMYVPEQMPETTALNVMDWDENFTVEKREQPKTETKKASTTLPPIEVPDDFVTPKMADDIFPHPESEPDFNPNFLDTKKEQPIENVDFRKVEFVPVYPGCEGLDTNDERKTCMQEKINKLISRKFDTNIGSKYGLSGMNRIDVQFTVDENGKIVDVKTRAPHPALEKEAERVIELIPQMKPGKQRDKSVRVIYGQPILFKTEN